MKKNLKISLIQSNLRWEDVDGNLANFNKLLSELEDTEIILLPEMFNTSFSPKSTHLAENMNGETITWMKMIVKQKKCSIAGTLMIQENDKIYNRLVWISKKGEIYTYDKYHLFSLIQEQEYITKGEKRLIVNHDGWKICPLICYDLRFPVFSRNTVDYDILIYLANWPVKRIDDWTTLLKARSIENQSYTIGVNRLGKDGNEIEFNGESKVFDPSGKEILAAGRKNQVLNVELDFKKLQDYRKKFSFLKDRDKFLFTDLPNYT